MSKNHKRRFPRLTLARRRTPPGSAPGTLTIDPAAPKPEIRLFAYSADAFLEQKLSDPAQIAQYRNKYPVLWIDLDGLGDESVLKSIATQFNLHPLAMEDVVNVHQRSKVDQYGDHLYMVSRMVTFNDRLHAEQVSLFLGRDFVITFQEHPGDVFDPLRDRIRTNKGRIRKLAADFLAYSLIDAIIDSYFPVLETYGESIETLEDHAAFKPDRPCMTRIHDLRHDLLALRRAIWPQRESLNSLLRLELPLITPETRLYLRDAYDHCVQIIDIIETYRELTSGLMEVYLSSLSNRLNEVMKVLTIIATIFIPLSFIAGVWGMNFQHMPELRWTFGYPLAITLMALTALAFLIYFWRKGWLTSTVDPPTNDHKQ
ncbi:MAG TPA: magnesium/cobalt transporter CorA [Phycisphaerales bacterium]|nr:magnesium/cobalt transporter CorA [Phycisphaerales bacterium]